MGSNYKTKYLSRGFLNKEEGMAAFQAKVEIWHPLLTSAYFTVSDCNRQISLDFSYDGKIEQEQILNKLEVLIDELHKFKDELFKKDQL